MNDVVCSLLLLYAVSKATDEKTTLSWWATWLLWQHILFNQSIEFETHYWQHQQHIKNMRKKEAQKLVRNSFKFIICIYSGLRKSEKFTKGKCCCTVGKCSWGSRVRRGGGAGRWICAIGRHSWSVTILCIIIFKTPFLSVDYDDDNVAADGGYYDDNVDDQRIDEAIGSHDPSAECYNQISTLYSRLV